VMADHPSHYYRLGDFSPGGFALDHSGNGRDLSYGAPGLSALSPGALTGDSDGAVTGTAVMPIASGSVSGLPTGNAPRAIEAWFKRTSGTYQGLVAWGSKTGDSDSILAVRNGSTVEYWTGPTFSLQATGLTPSDGNWHQLVYTFDGSIG